MLRPLDCDADRQEAPFLVEHATREPRPGAVEPAPRLLITEHLRTSGLLERLSGDATRALLALLSCRNPNGRLRPDVRELCAILGVEERTARKWLGQLATTGFGGQPLVRIEPHESGLETVHPSPRLVGEVVPPPVAEPEVIEEGAGHREEIIRRSRAAYARPRAEVERDILLQLGHNPEEADDGPAGDVWRRLSALGVPPEQARRLMDSHPLEAITDQLDWLPLRGEVRNRARFVVAAVEGAYAPPPQALRDRGSHGSTAEDLSLDDVLAVGDEQPLWSPEEETHE
jgi:hypothetical protein